MKETIQFRPRRNFQIKASQVRLIDHNGVNLGVVPLGEAVSKARELGMDVIEMNSKTHPVVAKIGDYGKFLYEQKKQQAEAKKNQKISLVKELYAHPNTEIGDLTRQVEQSREFLTEGHKVKFVIKFRGRELSKPEIGKEKLLWIIEQLKDVIEECQPPSTEGRNMSIFLTPSKNK